MDIRDYFTIIRRSWRLLAVTTIVGALLAVVAHLVITPPYQSTAEVLVSTPEGGNPTEMLHSATVARDFVETLAALVRTDEIADRVSKTPDINMTAGVIATALTAIPVDQTPLLQISANDTDPAQAQRLAAATVAVLIDGRGRSLAAEPQMAPWQFACRNSAHRPCRRPQSDRR